MRAEGTNCLLHLFLIKEQQKKHMLFEEEQLKALFEECFPRLCIFLRCIKFYIATRVTTSKQPQIR